MSSERQASTLDIEWIALMEEAKALGLTTEEIRLFLFKTESYGKEQGHSK